MEVRPNSKHEFPLKTFKLQLDEVRLYGCFSELVPSEFFFLNILCIDTWIIHNEFLLI